MRYTKYILLFTFIQIFSLMFKEEVNTDVIYTETCYQLTQPQFSTDFTELPDNNIIQNSRRYKQELNTNLLFFVKINHISYFIESSLLLKEKNRFFYLISDIISADKVNLYLHHLF